MLDKGNLVLLVCVLGSLISGCARLSTVPASSLYGAFGTASVSRVAGVFSGPREFDLSTYRSYGVVAFWDMDSKDPRAREMCKAFVATLDTGLVVDGSPFAAKEAVTVWPVRTLADSTTARDALHRGAGNSWPIVSSSSSTEAACDVGTGQYDFETAREALTIASARGYDVSGRGPFLIQWSPALPSTPGDEPFMLVIDMSKVESFQEAQKTFRTWTGRLSAAPNHWSDDSSGGWWLNGIKHWFDSKGSDIIPLKSVRE